MAKPTGQTLLWPPSHFLAADETAVSDASFCFPSEFPYEFGMSSPTVESVAGSTETETSDEEEEDFLAGLTRRLNLNQPSPYETRKQQLTAHHRAEDLEAFYAKMRGSAGSPQSTLSWSGRSSGVSGDGTPNCHSRVPSPQTTPFADPWEVLYAAAGQVARLKMNRQALHPDFHNLPLNLSGAKNLSNQNLNQVHQQVNQNHQQCASVLGRFRAKPDWVVQQQLHMLCHEAEKCNRPVSAPQTAWPAQQKPQNHRTQIGGSGSRVVVPGGSSAKRGCGGTGVFLPRHYDSPAEPRKKTGCAPVLQPPKVVHALNLNINDLSATSQTRFSSAFPSDYDALLASRNALLASRNAILLQQRLNARREEIANYEARLPQEWTY